MVDIVISEFMEEAAVAELSRDFDVLYDAHLVDRPEELRQQIAQTRALIVRNRTQVRGELLAAAADLTCIGRLGVGLDNIDVEVCNRRGIAVYPATGANDVAVAEYVIAVAMVLLRGAYAATVDVAGGNWPRNQLMGREIAGKRLGLVGFGAIARATASRGAALGMSVCAFDPYVPRGDAVWTGVDSVEFDILLATSDVVSLHVPLSAETRNLIDARAISGMKVGAILINAARGGVVDEAALCDALKRSHLGGAALDVFAEEPVTAESGLRLAGVPNLVLTPHIAGLTEESNIRVSRLTAQNVRRHLQSPG